MMKYRPPRVAKTDVLHIYGPTGQGKTTLVHRVLESYRNGMLFGIKKEYYSKCGGLSRFWDGYDNQPICWIDDPVCLDTQKDMDSIQQLKNIFSTGNCQIEVKFGTMVFDSPIVIITSNASPREIALSTGEAADPIYRRLTDTCGSYHLKSRKQLDDLERYLYHCIDVALAISTPSYNRLVKPPIVMNKYVYPQYFMCFFPTGGNSRHIPRSPTYSPLRGSTNIILLAQFSLIERKEDNGV